MTETSVKKCYSASEKATIALEAVKGNLTYNELTKKYAVHATQITHWKNQLKEGVIGIFSHSKEKVDYEKDQLIEELYRKIGQLEVERDWLKKKSAVFGR